MKQPKPEPHVQIRIKDPNDPDSRVHTQAKHQLLLWDETGLTQARDVVQAKRFR